MPEVSVNVSSAASPPGPERRRGGLLNRYRLVVDPFRQREGEKMAPARQLTLCYVTNEHNRVLGSCKYRVRFAAGLLMENGHRYSASISRVPVASSNDIGFF